MKQIKILLVFLFIFSLFIQPGFAVKEETMDRYGITPDVKQEEREIKRIAPREKKVDFSMSLDVQQGFDNNVHLDSQKHMDGFIQGLGNAEIDYKTAWEGLTLIGGTDLFSIVFYIYNDSNIFVI